MVFNALFKHWSYRIFAPGTIMREKYEAFKQLLRYDVRCHEQMADFQDLLHSDLPEDLSRTRIRFDLFSDQIAGMIDCLTTMAPGKYVTLKDYHKKFDFYVRFLLAPPEFDISPPYVLPLTEINTAHKNIGNKAKNLAILKNELDALDDPFYVEKLLRYKYNWKPARIKETIVQPVADTESKPIRKNQ